MQVIVSATSSKVDDLILIETTTIIGDQVTTARTGYGIDELMENRFLSGDLETRVEALRKGAEAISIRAVEAHFKTLMKVLKKEPEVTEVGPFAGVGAKATKELAEKLEGALKKPRAKRTPKASQ